MTAREQKTLSVFAPAKINLFLHITGRRPNRYHDLQSLVAFADIGDQLEMSLAPAFQFEVGGPYAKKFQDTDLSAEGSSTNLVVQALHKMAAHLDRSLDLHVRLVKNLPLAGGIGGGSADAAAALWGALKLWDVRVDAAALKPVIQSLGADVPVCFAGVNSMVFGIGEILHPVQALAEMPILLVNPNKPCPTQDVFGHFKGPFRGTVDAPENLSNAADLVSFLKAQDNDLYDAACQIVPDIQNVIQTLRSEKSCLLARLSGSGATCFGLFEHEVMARLAAQNIKKNNPDWWVQQGWIGRAERY
jgi:4-diphosphocytidyl-2-C-methyl-D-erythritol kinase